MKILLFLSLLLSVQGAWADPEPGAYKIFRYRNDQEREAAEREQRSKPYEKPLMFPVDDFMVINSTEIYDHWIIFKGTESFTLSDFVKDGKFCAWRGGHRWISWNEWDDAILWTKISMGFQKYPCANLEDFCVICGRCRRKIKVSKEVEELEP